MLSKSKLCPVLVLLLLAGTATTASAKLTISKAATKNVSCSAGVCSATAASAWLNVNDLQNLLASSSVTVSAGSAAQDIIIGAPLTWASASSLALDAYRSVAVYQPVSDEGPGALTITTNDGGNNGVFRFLGKGSIGFLGTSNSLTIDGIGYMLVNSVASLASAVNANTSVHIALGQRL